MMERRPWSRRLDRQIPLRFRDELPRPPPALAPKSIPQPPSPNAESPSTSTGRNVHFSLTTQVGSRVRSIFTTSRNIFGLSRTFYGKEMPFDDPEAGITLQQMSNVSVRPMYSQMSSPTFYPFPNRSAFVMGDWFWNGGVQKSMQSFRELMSILGDPEFKLEDVRNVNWVQINKLLATDEEGEWVDEDAGWVKTPVTISVPYQPRRGQPSSPQAGTRNYVIDDFYHRNLVSVIQEKISSLTDCHLFHTQPYEMYWQSGNRQVPIRVQGELYTSPSFIDAYRQLQDSPGQPGCNLPRVIAALMFWSDATHLTSFGNAKLRPLYLYFGNELKYRRCKPTLNLCNHVAYFQSVCYLHVRHHRCPLNCCNSFPTPSKTLLSHRRQGVRHQVQHSWLTALASFSMLSGKSS
jgi:hypothetical protein